MVIYSYSLTTPLTHPFRPTLSTPPQPLHHQRLRRQCQNPLSNKRPPIAHDRNQRLRNSKPGSSKEILTHRIKHDDRFRVFRQALGDDAEENHV